MGVGWSYFVAWAGMCLTLVASLATSAAAICLRAERRTWEQNTARLKMHRCAHPAPQTLPLSPKLRVRASRRQRREIQHTFNNFGLKLSITCALPKLGVDRYFLTDYF